MKTTLFNILFLSSVAAVAQTNPLEGYTTQDFFLNREQAGCQPKGVKVDNQGRYMYVAEMCGHIANAGDRPGPASVSIFDLVTRKRTHVLQTPRGAVPGIIGNTEVEFSADDKWALVARAEGDSKSEVFPGFGMITVINAQTQKIAKYIPVKGKGAKIIARRPVRADGKQIVYVANYFSDDISVLDISNLQDDGSMDGSAHFITRTALRSQFIRPESRGYKLAPRGVAFTPDGQYAIILNTENGSLAIMDCVQHKQIAEIAPIAPDLFGKDVNVRHIVISKDGRMAYLSHMRGNGVSRISIPELLTAVKNSKKDRSGIAYLGSETWESLLVPFGEKRWIPLEDYPADHPQFSNRKWDLAHPNTIVLDPVDNRYLYVSHRTTSNKDYTKIDPRILGKIDILDTHTGEVIFSLVGGAQPTALDVTPDNRMLISGGFKDNQIYFFDLEKILQIYGR